MLVNGESSNYGEKFYGIHIHGENHDESINSNNWSIQNCWISGIGGTGLRVDGVNAVAGVCTNLRVLVCAGYAVHDTSDLGNAYIACLSESNGHNANFHVFSKFFKKIDPTKLDDDISAYENPKLIGGSFRFGGEREDIREPNGIGINENNASVLIGCYNEFSSSDLPEVLGTGSNVTVIGHTASTMFSNSKMAEKKNLDVISPQNSKLVFRHNKKHLKNLDADKNPLFRSYNFETARFLLPIDEYAFRFQYCSNDSKNGERFWYLKRQDNENFEANVDVNTPNFDKSWIISCHSRKANKVVSIPFGFTDYDHPKGAGHFHFGNEPLINQETYFFCKKEILLKKGTNIIKSSSLDWLKSIQSEIDIHPNFILEGVNLSQESYQIQINSYEIDKVSGTFTVNISFNPNSIFNTFKKYNFVLRCHFQKWISWAGEEWIR